MAIDFPNSPSLNDLYTVGETTWKWNGTKWKLVSQGPTGPTGPQGTIGNTGPTGPPGPQGVETGMMVKAPYDVNYVGYVDCDGSAISRTLFADLFNAIGTKYGAGDGSTTFNVPNIGPDWQPGRNLDKSFVANVVGPSNTGTPSVAALAFQPNGQLLIGGSGITSINGSTRDFIGRVNADGTLDTTFAPTFNNSVINIKCQSDGKIIAVGTFTTVNGSTHNRICRLNADGTNDATFAGDVNGQIRKVLIQPDGKLIIAGDFTSVWGTTRTRIARLNSDGTLDTSFNVNSTGAVTSIGLQSDGKIVLGGLFTNINSTSRNYLARVNADGTLDTSFGNLSFDNTINALAIQPDGKIIVGGNFTSIFPSNLYNRIARVTSTNTLDTTFVTPDGGSFKLNAAVQDILIQSDSKIVIVGGFTTLNNAIVCNSVLRLNSDLSIDKNFNPDIGSLVNVAIQQPSNNGVILGMQNNPATAGGIPIGTAVARFNNLGYAKTLIKT